MTINKAKVGITKGEDPGSRAVMKQKPKPTASHAKSRPGMKGQKPDESGPETWAGGIDHFHEGA